MLADINLVPPDVVDPSLEVAYLSASKLELTGLRVVINLGMNDTGIVMVNRRLYQFGKEIRRHHRVIVEQEEIISFLVQGCSDANIVPFTKAVVVIVGDDVDMIAVPVSQDLHVIPL